MSHDTIAAIATPPGMGGIGVIRVSGPQTKSILTARFIPFSPKFHGFQARVLHYGYVVDATGEKIDEVLVVFMPGPHSFTGEDSAEWHCHGSPILLEAVLESLIEAGARMAERGEFTRRAFLNGRMDLTQAEAVTEVVSAKSRQGAHLAINRLDGLLGQRMNDLREKLENLRANLCLAVDFPDDELESFSRDEFLSHLTQVRQSVTDLLESFDRTRCWREGVTVALAGPVNAGKSSLLNAFLGQTRAIVTEYPGTTRDFLEESVRLDGLPVRMIDTAGLRHKTTDPIELQGIRMGEDKTASADVILLIFDGSQKADLCELAKKLGHLSNHIILIWNKCDITPPPENWAEMWLKEWQSASGTEKIPLTAAVSAKKGEGLDDLARMIRRVAVGEKHNHESADNLVPNLRQALNLRHIQKDIDNLAKEIQQNLPFDLCSVHLESAVMTLAEITGLNTPDEVLNRIFASFCVGK